MAAQTISLVIPAHNEEYCIEKTIAAYKKYLEKNFSGYEIITVCNNCSDKTPLIVEQLSRNDNHIVFMNFPYYTGKGGALIEGFKKAKYSLVAFVDADNSTVPEEFAKLVAESANYDIVIASRSLPGSVLPIKQPFLRRLLGRAFSLIVELLFGLSIKDTQCGAKLFNKKVLDKLLPGIKSKGFEIDVEMLWKAKNAGYSIKEVPISWSNSAKSSVKTLDPVRMLFGLLKLRFS